MEALHNTPPVPVMHPEQFAALIGLKPDVVRGWVDNRHVPTIKIGRYRMINLALLTQDCLTGGEEQ